MVPTQVRLKYAVDRAVASVGLIVLSPVFGAIALAIKLEDRGPVFFFQERPGLHGEPFTVWKFRSMVVDADNLLDENGLPTGRRVTRVGKVLRRSSLDEIPQLVNIARGDMSFIGPRPALPSHVPRYTDGQLQRFRMRPGVTGLAQVSGRNSLKWSRRIELDNDYIDNYSLLADARILFRTVSVVLRGSGQAPDRNPDQVDDLGPASSPAKLATTRVAPASDHDSRGP